MYDDFGGVWVRNLTRKTFGCPMEVFVHRLMGLWMVLCLERVLLFFPLRVCLVWMTIHMVEKVVICVRCCGSYAGLSRVDVGYWMLLVVWLGFHSSLLYFNCSLNRCDKGFIMIWNVLHGYLPFANKTAFWAPFACLIHPHIHQKKLFTFQVRQVAMALEVHFDCHTEIVLAKADPKHWVQS